MKAFAPEMRGYLIDLTRRAAEKACSAKVRHASRWQAEEALRDVKQRGRAGTTLQVYPCEFCDGFHLGNLA